MRTARRITLLAWTATLLAGQCVAQSQFRRGSWAGDTGPMVQTEGGDWVNEDTVRTARETAPHSIDLPAWTNTPGFDKDVFIFTRIIFKSAPGGPSWLGWINDYPDANLNLSARLQLLTSIKTDPDCRVLKLTDPALPDHPFIFMSHPERMELRDDEANALRKYLLNGGALLADDFWGDRSWAYFEKVMKRVLPGSTWTELSMEHPVVPLRVRFARADEPIAGAHPATLAPPLRPGQPGVLSLRLSRPRLARDARPRLARRQAAHHGLAIHNSDTGDGWEREGEDEVYFHQFSENRAYPLAVNAIFYLMTH